MGTLSAESASQKRSKYSSYIDDVIYDINKNFNDMDFENAVQRTIMKSKIDTMIWDCEQTKRNLNNLNFS